MPFSASKNLAHMLVQAALSFRAPAAGRARIRKRAAQGCRSLVPLLLLRAWLALVVPLRSAGMWHACELAELGEGAHPYGRGGPAFRVESRNIKATSMAPAVWAAGAASAAGRWLALGGAAAPGCVLRG